MNAGSGFALLNPRGVVSRFLFVLPRHKRHKLSFLTNFWFTFIWIFDILLQKNFGNLFWNEVAILSLYSVLTVSSYCVYVNLDGRINDGLMNGWILTNCANGTQLPLHNAWLANNLSSQMWYKVQTTATTVISNYLKSLNKSCSRKEMKTNQCITLWQINVTLPHFKYAYGLRIKSKCYQLKTCILASSSLVAAEEMSENLVYMYNIIIRTG
jgi:hypothetical protein